MSFQRVLETARKTGFPVIVTDIAGREPMVILPLEQFEGMLETGETSGRSPSKEAQHSQEIVTVPISESVSSSQAEKLAKEPGSVRLEAISESPSDEGEIPLEERFYLEPVDDK